MILKSTRIEPAGHRLLIQPDEVEEVSDGGIVLVHKDKRLEKANQTYGTLVKVGQTAWKAFDEGKYQWAEVGDRVVYARSAGITLIDPETEDEFILINDEDIAGIIR